MSLFSRLFGGMGRPTQASPTPAPIVDVAGAPQVVDGPPKFEVAIRRMLAPVLRADGFAGSGATFWKRVDDAILIVNVQRSSGSGRFAINLGVLPVSDDEIVPARVKEYDCVFRGRLSPDDGDCWWDYDPGEQASMDSAMATAAGLYADRGRRTFAAFEGPASLLATTTAQQFDETRWAGLNVWPAAAPLALAKLRRRQGREDEARAFARLTCDIAPNSGLASEAKTFLI